MFRQLVYDLRLQRTLVVVCNCMTFNRFSLVWWNSMFLLLESENNNSIFLPLNVLPWIVAGCLGLDVVKVFRTMDNLSPIIILMSFIPICFSSIIPDTKKICLTDSLNTPPYNCELQNVLLSLLNHVSKTLGGLFPVHYIGL